LEEETPLLTENSLLRAEDCPAKKELVVEITTTTKCETASLESEKENEDRGTDADLEEIKAYLINNVEVKKKIQNQLVRPYTITITLPFYRVISILISTFI
jgi:hypothetical protein